MAETRVERPFNILSNPTSFEKELDPVRSPLLKRKELDSRFPQQVNLKRPAEEELEQPQAKKSRFEAYTPVKEESKKSDLFPEIKRSLPLPDEDEVEEVQFDRPAFVAPREKQESKPALPLPAWADAKPPKKDEAEESTIGSWIRGMIPWGKEKSGITVGSHREEKPATQGWVKGVKPQTARERVEPLIGYEHRVNYKHQKETQDELSHLPNHGGAVLAKLVGMITDYQNLSQVSQLELFADHSDRLEELRKQHFENIKKQIANCKDMETWSHRRDALEYLGIASGLVGGATLISSSMATGGTSFAPGVKMLAGSGLALGAKLSERYWGRNALSTTATIGGAVLSGWGALSGMRSLGSIETMISAAGETASSATNFIIGRKMTQNRADSFGINADNVQINYKRETNEQDMRKIVGALKASKASTDLLGATTKALRTENEIKSQIALGNKY